VSDLKLATGSNGKVAEARGLVGQEMAIGVDLRPDLIYVDAVTIGFVELRPGEETTIVVSVAGLPPNANVRSISATLTVAETLNSPLPETVNASITRGSGNQTETQNFASSVTPSLRPRNVQVRLDQGSVFWSHDGTLTEDSYILTDFASAVNRYLDQAKITGETKLQFQIKSDTPGRLRIEINPGSLHYTLLQTQTWPNPLDGTIRLDRNMSVDFGQVTQFQLDPPQGRPLVRLMLDRVRLDVSGQIGAERLLGDAPPHSSAQFATISGDYGLAQSFRLQEATPPPVPGSMPAPAGGTPALFKAGVQVHVAGVTGVLAADAEAELYIEIQKDANGHPATDPPLGRLNLTLVPAQNRPSPWLYAAFQATADLDPDTLYWVVIKGIRGKARLGLQTGPASYLHQTLINRGGQLWKPVLGRKSLPSQDATAPLALLRLVYLPEPDTQTAGIELRLGDVGMQRLDPSNAVQSVTVEGGGPVAPGSVLTLCSFALGTVTLANVVQEFAPA
jgi:hypothetical protein